MQKPSPLAALILSDTHVADSMSETKRALTNAYDRIDDLQISIQGLLGLLQTIADRPDVSREIREAIINNIRVSDARELL